VRVCLVFFLLHRLAAAVTTFAEVTVVATSPLVEPVGSWLPAVDGVVVLVGGGVVAGDEDGGEVVGVPDVVVGDGLVDVPGVRGGSVVVLLAQLAELEGDAVPPGLPEEAGCDVFTAALPVPPPGLWELEDTDPVLVLAGEIESEAVSPT
jgi:hypothetical protein